MIKDPHDFVTSCKFLATPTDVSDHFQPTEDVISIDEANELADEIVRLRKELDKISSILNRNLTTDNKVYEINKILSKEWKNIKHLKEK